MVLLLGSCGSGVEVRSEEDLRVRRLIWKQVGELPEQEHQLYAGWSAGDQQGQLTLVPSEAIQETRTGADGDALVVAPGRSVELTWSGELEAQRFDQIAVTLRAPTVVRPQLLLLDGRSRKLRSPRLRLHSSESPTRLVFDLPALHRRTNKFERLVLDLGALRLGAEVFQVELVQRPLSSWIRGPASGDGLADIDLQLRSATALSSMAAVKLVCSPRPGERLHFYVGDPPEARRSGERKTLEVSLRAGDETQERAVDWTASSTGTDASSEWTRLEFDLDDMFSPEDERVLHVRVELQVEGVDEAVCALGPPLLTRPGDAQPTVVLITSDTHRADHLGVASAGRTVKTPFLDSLASTGVRFTDCTSTTNLTIPSHAGLLTGVAPRDMALVSNRGQLVARATTLADRFAASGWLCCAAVSVPKLASSGVGQGFDVLLRPGGVPADADVTMERVRALLAEAEGLPLFLWVHLFDAHTPYKPPGEYSNLHYEPGLDPRKPNGTPLPRGFVVEGHEYARDINYVINLYRGEVTHLDAQLRRAFEEERLQDAIIAFTADHGESLTGHGTYFRHSCLYPSTLDIPLILRWPGCPAGTVIDRPVDHLDVGRTLLDLAGLPAEGFPGDNLMEAASPESPPRFAIAGEATEASIRWKGMYLVLYLDERIFESRVATKHSVELYDLETDPDCENDVIDERPHEASALRRLLVAWLTSPATHDWAHVDAATDAQVLQELAALGYADGQDLALEDWFDLECACAWCSRFE